MALTSTASTDEGSVSTAARPPLSQKTEKDLGQATYTLLVQEHQRDASWSKKSQAEQQTALDRCWEVAQSLVRRAASAIAQEGYEAGEAQALRSVDKGEYLEASFRFEATEENNTLLFNMMRGGKVAVVNCSAGRWLESMKPIAAMKDQPDLGFTDEERQNIGEHDAETGELVHAGDDLANGLQAEALGHGGDEVPGGGTGGVVEREALGPEAIANGERLEAGISAIAPGVTEPVEATGTAPKRKGRRTAEQIVADNAAAAAQEPPPKRTRKRAEAALA